MIRRILKLILFLPLFLLPVWLAGQAYHSLSQRDVTYTYIAEALDPLSITPSNVVWHDPDQPLDRPFTTSDRARVGLALTEAWQVMAASQASGQTEILKDRLTGVALTRALIAAQDATRFGGRISVLTQDATPIFYHKDGSVLQVSITLFVARYVVGENGLPFHQVSRDQGVVTLMNETSGWRVFSYERKKSEPVKGGTAPWHGPQLLGVNYYPAAAPWRAFWIDFDPDQIAADFDRLRNLGGNAVRVFLTYDDFADEELAPNNLKHLEMLLDIAQAKGIWVIPTLFDLKQSFGPGSWATDHIYLENVLNILRSAPAVTFIDLKNEADLDFASHGESEIKAWLRTMLVDIRQLAPELSVTVGWSSPDAADNLVDVLDVVSYHDFGKANATSASLAQVQRIANGLPIVVSEIGASSFDIALGFPGSESRQAAKLAHQLESLSGIDGVLIWTLYDFPKVDRSVIGLSPWRQQLQAAFGLFHADGREKIAARVVRRAFTLSQPF